MQKFSLVSLLSSFRLAYCVLNEIVADSNHRASLDMWMG